jgi:hypothetical protein
MDSLCSDTSFMKLLIFLFSLNALAAETCIKDPKMDYQKQFGLTKVENWQADEMKLNDDQLADLNLTTEEQCGAKGCEGALYWQKEKGCFKRVLFYEGSLKILTSKNGRLKDIQIGKKIYKYSLLSGQYE